MSIRLRLTLIYTGLVTVALVLFSGLTFNILRWTYVQSVDDTIREVAAFTARYYRDSGYRYLPDPDQLADRLTYVLIRTDDQIVLRSGNLSGFFALPEAARDGKIAYITETDMQGRSYRLITVPVMITGQKTVYVQVAHPLTLLDMTADRLRAPLLAGVAAFVLVAALAAWWLAGRAIEPVLNIARAAATIGQSADLSMRVPYRGAQDEVGMLVQTFNDMLAQLEGLYGRLAATVDTQKRFVADASHELRTPLTIIRGNLDYLKRAGELDPEALADLQAEAERMSRLVEELLVMARADAGQEPALEPVMLAPLVRDLAHRAEKLPRDATFQVDLPAQLDTATVLGHAEWLRRAVLILIDNAFKYTPAGTVTVRLRKQGQGFVVEVADTGIGIPESDQAHIFERFYRADRARSRGGTGLGLAIAHWVATFHRGALTVQSQVGRGSTFRLWLPAALVQNPTPIS